MTEPNASEQPTPEYEVSKDGRIIIEGVDVTHILNPDWSDTPPEDVKPKADPDNAALEGEAAAEAETTEETEKAEPKKEAEPETPAEETPAEPEAEVKDPQKLKFKLKFRGDEQEVEYDPDQIQVRLTKLRAFEENEKQFWEKRKEVEPYAHIVKTDWFKEKLREAYESGDLERPPQPAAIPPVVQYEIVKRQAEPDYPEILNALQAYALQLPQEAMQLIDANAEVFLTEYDRIAKEVRAKKTAPAKETVPEKAKLSPDEVKAKLALKEKAKSSAAVTKPGTSTEPVTPQKRWEERKRTLERALRSESNANRSVMIAAELLTHMDNRP